MRPLILSTDNNGRNADIPPASDHVYNIVLAANTAKSVTAPGGAKFVAFAANGTFYARYNGSAAIPSADVTDGAGSEVNPSARSLDGVETIGLVAPASTIVSLSWY